MRHPNSYLPKYIASETDGENVPLTSGNGPSSMQRQRQINGLDIGPHQIVESDDEDIPPYGFPSHGKRRNRRDGSDIDLVLGSGGTLNLVYYFANNFLILFSDAIPGENSSLLGHNIGSNSDISTHLCEIDDSEYEQEQMNKQQQQHLHQPLKSSLNTSKNSTNSSSSSKSGKKSVKFNNNVQQTEV